MTKTERNKTINKLVYKYAESLGYEVDMSEIDVTFIPESGRMDDCIEYRRSSHSVAALNWACAKTLEDEKLIDDYITNIQLHSDLEFMRWWVL
jgi:cell fate regulator YaaT (PSP1 superfamily)